MSAPAHAVRLPFRFDLAAVALDPELLEQLAETPVLIWSGEHRLYWRAERAGYTPDRDRAGRYAFAEAFASTSHCGPEKAIAFELAPTNRTLGGCA